MGRIIDFIEHLSEQANNQKKVRIAEACKTGDAMAMYEMAYMMRSQCNPEEIELLERYEDEPSQENAEKLSTRKNLSLMAKSYMIGVVRAALYGSADAAELIEKCSLYKKLAYIPYDMLTGKSKDYISIWKSTVLYEIGFIDVPQNMKNATCLMTQIKEFMI